MQTVRLGFASDPAIRFATGVYELTNYDTAGMGNLKDTPQKRGILARFPLLFFRPCAHCGFAPTRMSDGVAVVENRRDGVQDIF